MSLQTYGIKELREREESAGSSREKVRERRRVFPHTVEENIVGLEDNVNELVNVLVDEEKNFRVMSIFGMGGLGKTTLAKKVYNHEKVMSNYNNLAWVYISQQCRRRDVWEGILSGLTSGADAERILKLRDEQLAEELHKFLQDNKCMVVLDDIWSIEAWDSLKAAFPNKTESKILLTTRNKDLALYADPKGFLHEPKCLKDVESWELFHKIAFARVDDTPDFKIDERMEELGKQMVGHCAGLPLAITVLGGLLATKHTLKQWRMVAENIQTYITKGIGYGEDRSAVSDVLSLSYDDLLPHLKQCFLCLGHFPEDYEIPVDKLIKFWIADGIVPSDQYRGGGQGKNIGGCG
ncbi:putative disease resistance protein At1g50180 [Carica papaya]|uniref:putative disease resistance protein At1g50180 n=1 Tax=Carica papaya TaxID=3649 RepID=UPI000B8D00A7|nr:putative disease resistance protein At1g50180 [Carica papaya]